MSETIREHTGMTIEDFVWLRDYESSERTDE